MLNKNMIKISYIRMLFIISAFIYTIELAYSNQKNTEENLNYKTNEQLLYNLDYENIVKQYKNLIEKYPDKKELFFNLGNINYLNGDSQSAIQNYKNSLIDSDPEVKADALYNIGNTFFQMGDYQKSINFFKESLSIDPYDKDAQYNYELSKKMLSQSNPQNQSETNQNNNQNSEDGGQSQDGNKQSSDNNQENNEDLEKNINSSEEDKDSPREGNDKQEDENSLNKNDSPQNSEDTKDLGENNSDLGPLEGNKTGNDQQTEAERMEAESKLLGKKEAEAILNALKADAKNLKYKKYKSASKVKNVEKDW